MNEATEIRPAAQPATSAPATRPDDWASDQEVRWCPGCGDYAILKAIQRTLPELGAEPHKTAFISGIGCSSRFPYYMETYGFHTIHGRAPAIATGVKLANPDLDVWLITGDGDGLSIGGNHMLHLLRRNLDCQVLLFNNEIYGLTKGQYSPTSRPGTTTPTSPGGSLDQPVKPCAFAIGAGGRFVARCIDTDQKRLPDIFKRAHAFKGTGFIEIYQNCVVFNDGVFENFTGKKTAPQTQLWAEHGKPLLFDNGTRGLRLDRNTLRLEVIAVTDANLNEVLVHDETNKLIANLLIDMPFPEFPVALGVLYTEPSPSYEQAVVEQGRRLAAGKAADLGALLRRGQTWKVELRR